MTAWVISHAGSGRTPGSTVSASFSVASTGGHQVGSVLVEVSYTALGALREETGLAGVPESVARWAVRHLADRVKEGGFADADPTDPILETWDLTSYDLAEIVAQGVKRCEWQVAQGRDLYCLAAALEDDTADLRIEDRRAAPTSVPLCADCAVPDEALLCSHFSHPRLVGQQVDGGTIIGRDVVSAVCNQGLDGIHQAPGDCRPGGHPCWEQTVALRPPELRRSDLPITEALDHLSVAWRLRFGRDARLVAKVSSSAIAGLEAGCASRDEFGARLRDLKEVLDRLDIPDHLVAGDDDGDPPPEGSLDRLQRCLDTSLSGEQLPEASNAVERLRMTNKLRGAFEHDRANVPRRLQDLGLPYPPSSWTDTWVLLRAQTADVFLDLARAVSPK